MFWIGWTNWRRDLVVGVLTAIMTAAVLVPIGWAAVRDQRDEANAARERAEEARLRAEQTRAEAEQQRLQAQRNLVERAADAAGFGARDRSEAEVLRVSTAAVAPEIPEGAFVLIDKKAVSYAPGDIVIYRFKGNNYLGRVIAVEKEAGRLTVGRNGEANRQVAIRDVVGRGVLNSR
jgi:uncharacterized protein involved in type VI secretion and phage assembly